MPKQIKPAMTAPCFALFFISDGIRDARRLPPWAPVPVGATEQERPGNNLDTEPSCPHQPLRREDPARNDRRTIERPWYSVLSCQRQPSHFSQRCTAYFGGGWDTIRKCA